MDKFEGLSTVKIIAGYLYDKIHWPITVAVGVGAMFVTDYCMGSLMNRWYFGDWNGRKPEN